MLVHIISAIFLSFSFLICNGQSIIVGGSFSVLQIDSIIGTVNTLNKELAKAGYPGIEVKRSNTPDTKSIFISISKKKIKSSATGSGPEVFSIISDGKKVSITGNTALGVQHGVFKYLETLGFRYYFPDPVWYIVPFKPSLFKNMNLVSGPSLGHRSIWYGYGTGSLLVDTNYRFWYKANRLGGSMQAVVGHSYEDIILRNKDVFLQHPEWFYPAAPKGTIPMANPKFDLANEELVQFIIKDVLKRLDQAKAKNTPLKMVSLCPSDGMGTCNTPACQGLGTITDRVYSLINRVAKAVNQKHPGTLISGMAYSEYSAPPTKKLETNTFVSIATAFNYTKYSTDQLIQEWGKKAGLTGIYDYLGLYVWDFDLPGKGQASRIDKTVALVKKYYRLGARGYDTESTPGSINKGLGHFIISRLLWDINANTAALKKEFFTQCFGRASGLMTQLWNVWESYPYDGVRESDLAAWIDMVKEAGKLETNTAVGARLAHINTYLHYLYLYSEYRKTKAEPEMLALLTYCYNTMDLGTVSGYPALFEIGNVSPIPGFAFNDPNAKYKRRDLSLSMPSRVDKLIAADRKKLQRKEDVKIFVPTATKFRSPALSPVFKKREYNGYKETTAFTGIHYFVLEIKNPGEKNYLELSGGLVNGGGSAKPISVTVAPYTGVVDMSQNPLLQYDYSGSRDTQQVRLNKLAKGYYLMKVEDPAKMFRLTFSPSIPYSIIVTPQNRFNGYSRYLSFYVPAGIAAFRVFKEIEAILVSPSGRVVDLSKKGSEEIDIKVLNGEEGLWMINFVNGYFHIEGVPPFMSMNPEQMLIPSDLQ